MSRSVSTIVLNRGHVKPFHAAGFVRNGLSSLIEKALRVAALAARIQRFPPILDVAFGTGHFSMVLIEREVRHHVVIKPQVVTLPTIHAVALGALVAEYAFVWIVLLVAGEALVVARRGFDQRRDAQPVPAALPPAHLSSSPFVGPPLGPASSQPVRRGVKRRRPSWLHGESKKWFCNRWHCR